MSEHLPESLDDWPDDPFTLLDVSPDVDARSARRAYTRLARKFKPEHHPLEFQRIRAAYDAVIAIIGSGSEPRFGSPPRQEAESPDLFQYSPTRPDSPDDDGELQKLWLSIPTADAQMAYDQMVQLADSRLKGQVAVYLRLHWALAMQTSLDSERSPIDWIAIGLIETGGGSEELRGLYASSLRMFRGSVSHNRADELLEAPALTGNELAELIAVRWEALRTKQDWPRISEELRLCRDRILTDDPDLHVRLAIYAAKQGLWADSDAGQKFFQQCFRESMAYDEVQLRMEEELAHIEALSELRYHVSVMRRGIPREVLTVIRRSVAEPFEDVEADIARMLALWLSRPKASLANIDELTYESSLASFMLYKACMEYRDSVFAEYHDSVEPAAMDVFLSRHHASDAAELRYAILEFCKAQYLPLHDFISAIGETKVLDRADREALSGHLTQDLTLHCMITGSLAILAAGVCSTP